MTAHQANAAYRAKTTPAAAAAALEAIQEHCGNLYTAADYAADAAADLADDLNSHAESIR